MIRLGNQLSNVQRKGWSASAQFPSNFSIRLEARLNTLAQSPSTGIDELLEIWILDPANLSRYDKVALSAPAYGSTRIFTAGSSITKLGLDTGLPSCGGVGQGAFTFSDNTWYRLVITGSPSQEVRLSVYDDSETTELVGVGVGHTLSSYSSGFTIGLSQSMGFPEGIYPTNVALDWIKLSGSCEAGPGNCSDIFPPAVTLTGTVLGQLKQVLLDTLDGQSGLASIQVLKCANCTATTDSFHSGTNAKVRTTATKTDPSQSSSIQIKAIDVAGNCVLFDPVDITIEADGKVDVHEVKISADEHVVQINNGFPGIQEVVFKTARSEPLTLHLTGGETRTIDIGSMLEPGRGNQVRIFSSGRAGGTASVVFTQP